MADTSINWEEKFISSNELLTKQVAESVVDIREGMKGKATADEVKLLRGEVSGLRADMKEEISGLRADMKEEISGLRADMKEEISVIRGEINGLRNELKGEMATKEQLTSVKEEVANVKEEVKMLRGEIGTIRNYIIFGFLGALALAVASHLFHF